MMRLRSWLATDMIWVRKTACEHGHYVDDNGTRWLVEWCVGIVAPDNKGPEDFGYSRHESIKAAVELWGLETYVEPIEDDILTGEEGHVQEG